MEKYRAKDFLTVAKHQQTSLTAAYGHPEQNCIVGWATGLLVEKDGEE